MKNYNLTSFIVIIIVLLLGVFIGFTIKSNQMKMSGKPIDLNPFPKSCEYNGKTYKSGDGFKDMDGCNSCSCNDGEVACTLMYCEGK